MNSRATTVALIGDPVAHSVSPPMHRAAFEAVGLDIDYVTLRMPRADLGDGFPIVRRSFAGLNVTRPLKEAVLPLLDEISAEAVRAGSVNTVVLRAGRASGFSTDGAGFVAALRGAGVDHVGRAVIMGTGGVARALAVALADIGSEVLVVGRNPEAAVSLASVFGGRAVPVEGLARAVEDSDLLVNATPLGGPDESSPVPDRVGLPSGLTVFDLVYRPRRTSLLRRAEASGCRIVEGVEMLIEQGARSFELWTGVGAPVGAMRQAAYRALDARAEVAS